MPVPFSSENRIRIETSVKVANASDDWLLWILDFKQSRD